MPRKAKNQSADATGQEQAAVEAGRAGQGNLSKMEAVRRALRELGKDARPRRIRDFVQDRFQMDLDPNLISNYKKKLAGKVRRRKGTASRPVPAPERPAPPASAEETRVTAQGSIALDDIRTVRELIGRLGANDLRALIDLLAR